MVILKDQLAICKQDLQQLWARGKPVEPEEAQEINEAVHREIKRRRKIDAKEDRPITLDERRAYGKDIIMSYIKELKFSLAAWQTILT